MAAQYAPSPFSPAIVSDSGSETRYSEGLFEEERSPVELPILNGDLSSEAERRQWVSHQHQMAYNKNRVQLGRSINRTVDTLKDFQTQNSKWPAHYPNVRRPEHLARRQSTRPDLQSHDRPSSIRRTATSLDEEPEAAGGGSTEPRLVTNKLAEDFNILKLDLKLGQTSPSELVHSLEKSAVASLLDGKISQSIKHLMALRDRIEDTSSKVLVTGDLNAGKSTFCNALLRKKVLPEDQQPCTEIFCEVLDATENSHIEEVHAILKNGSPYDRRDETTFDVYSLDKLEDIVVDNDKYSQVKVYVEDVRTIDESLLRNGVVDIALIDAPGLNTDSLKTTAVFARQEEIDVVVFVVSAENHFTLSAKEFIWNAAHEKAYIFIVVNRYDNIRNKDRCQRMILDQVGNLSPRTHQDAKELVHFVSSNAVIDGTDEQKVREFEKLEQSLRSFVLEKRARSKLAPAKTYLLNLLGDIENLASCNKQMTEDEFAKVVSELEELMPAYEAAINSRITVSEQCDKMIEDTAAKVLKCSRRTISTRIAEMADRPLVPYNGFFSSYYYAEATKRELLQQVQAAVAMAEQRAREETTQGVSRIGGLGALHLGGDYVQKTFRSDLMFTRRRDQLQKSIKTEVDVLDFFDFDFDFDQEKLLGGGAGMALVTVATSNWLGFSSWFDGLWKASNLLGVNNARRMLLPAIALATVAGGYFVVSDIPNAVPRKLARKIRAELQGMDYVNTNSERIARETRKVLRTPAEELRSSLQMSLEKQGRAMEEKKAIKKDSEVAMKYFGNLLRDAKDQRKTVERLDLEAQVHL